MFIKQKEKELAPGKSCSACWDVDEQLEVRDSVAAAAAVVVDVVVGGSNVRGCRMVPAAASLGLVAPISSRFRAIAFSPSRT